MQTGSEKLSCLQATAAELPCECSAQMCSLIAIIINIYYNLLRLSLHTNDSRH